MYFSTVELSNIDSGIILLFLAVTIYLAMRSRSVASKDLQGFFLGGRNLPWYMAGLSMVATTFAADTPLAVTEIVASNGIAGNWIWWSFLAGGMFTTFFFSRYWQKSGVTTEIELINLRYGGQAAKWLRIIKAFYLGLLMNILVMAWVNLAMMSLLDVFIPRSFANTLIGLLPAGISPSFAVLCFLLLFTSLLSALSGLKGIALMDAFQFSLAMIGCISLAWLVISSPEIGGIERMKAHLPEGSLNFFPTFNASATEGFSLGIGAFLAYAGVMWWSSWYPGQEPGGGGYVAQRMMSVPSESDALKATLLFQIAHYVIRPWPWILVALAALILYPELGPDETRLGYVMAMRDYLPAGLKGLMLAGFLGAYMSTISTQLNWGASYLVNDAYLPLSKKTEATSNLIAASRLFTLVLMILAAAVSTQITSIKGVWEFIIECGAGLGLVLILRWFWWRINVWSEISATLAPFAIYAIGKFGFSLQFPESFFLTVGLTSLIWIVITLITPPEKPETLAAFVGRIQPAGMWPSFNNKEQNQRIKWQFLAWIFAILCGYGGLFFIGHLILLQSAHALITGIVLLCGLIGLRYSIRKGALAS